MIRLNIDTTSKKKMNAIFCVLTFLLVCIYISTAYTPRSLISLKDIPPMCKA